MKTPHRLRVTLVTNFCQYYRVPLYESLASTFDIHYYFFSPGDEKYWLAEQGVASGDFPYSRVPGFRVLGTSINLSLPKKLWRGAFDVYISGIVGRFALPVTYAIARLRRRPFILWTQIWMRIQTPAHRLFFPVTRYLYRHADAVVAGGEHVKRYLISEGVEAERIFSCGNATRNEDYTKSVSSERRSELRQDLGIRSEQKVVLSLGRVEKEKGLEDLIQAYARIADRNSVLVIAGSGSDPGYRGSLEELGRSLGIAEEMRFPGFVPNEKAYEYYAISYVFVLSSITTKTFREPWGLVVNEAFCQGVPVIATDAVGAAAGGMLRDGEEGFVVPEQNSEEMGGALKRILGDEDLRQSMSHSAKKRIDAWDIERMADGFRRAIAHVKRRR